MKFRCAAGALATAAALAALLLWPRPESRPLTDHTPDDALLYAEFRSLDEAERLAKALLPRDDFEALLSQLSKARPHLAGEVAVYLDRHREWVALARLTDGTVAVKAQTTAALERHQILKRSLSENPGFQGAPIHINLEALRPPGRLGDFSAAGLHFDPGPPLTFHGRLSYRRDRFRTCLEYYVHAPGRGAPGGTNPIRASFLEHLPRAWEELLNTLDPETRKRVEHEAFSLRRDLLDGRSVSGFLAKLGPSCGFMITSSGALLGWIELPDAETRETLEAILDRVTRDLEQHIHPPPLTVCREGDVRHVSFTGDWARRLGDGFAPAYTFDGNRLLLTTRAPFPEFPSPAPVRDHLSIEIETLPAFGAFRALEPVMTEPQLLAFREAQKLLERFESFSLKGRFTGEGLEVNLQARRRE